MSILNLKTRLIGADDISWGMGSLVYQDYQGVARHMPMVNAGIIPATSSTSIWDSLLDVTAVHDQTELATAITEMGSTYGTIYLWRGTYNFLTDTNIPGNIRLWFENGALVNANNCAIIIDGPIQAGPHQIFSWSGTGVVDCSSSPTQDFPAEWFGFKKETVGGALTTYDNSAALFKALSALTTGQRIILSAGIWRLHTPITYDAGSASACYPPSIEGVDEFASILWFDMSSTDVGIDINPNGLNSNGYMAYFPWFKNLTLSGPANCCKNAIRCYYPERGGFDAVNVALGCTDYAILVSNSENMTYRVDFTPDYLANYLGVSYGQPANGIGLIPRGASDWGCGTYNRVRIKKSTNVNCASALTVTNGGDVYIEQSDIENCQFSSGPYWSGGWLYSTAPLYTGATTRAAEVFTVTGTTVVKQVMFRLQTYGGPPGTAVAKLYATSGGAPTGAALATSDTLPVYNITGGIPKAYLFTFPGAGYSLAAGTYAVSLEYSDAGSGASNYLNINNDASTAGRPQKGFTYSGSWSAQTWDLRYAINPSGAINLTNVNKVNIDRLHAEENNLDLLLDQCYNITLKNLDCYSGAWITRTRTLVFDCASLGGLFTSPDSLGFIFNNVEFANCTPRVYGDVTFNGSTYTQSVLRGPNDIEGFNASNYAYNNLFTRWQSDRPDAWDKGSHSTWTHCTTNDGSVYAHRTPNFGKLVTTANDEIKYYVPTEVVNALAGQWVSFSIWALMPAGQVWSGTAGYFQTSAGAPVWASGTTYNIGDAISDGYVAIYPGTSAGVKPTFNWLSLDGDYVYDNNQIVWAQTILTPLQGGVFDSSMSDGKWHQYTCILYLPTNATSLQISAHINKQSGGNTTIYLAEPSLTVGSRPLKGLQPYNPISSVLAGAVRIDSDAYIPTNSSSKLYGSYSLVGDIVYNTGAAHSGKAGWICTTAGTNGSGSVWYTFGAID